MILVICLFKTTIICSDTSEFLQKHESAQNDLRKASKNHFLPRRNKNSGMEQTLLSGSRHGCNQCFHKQKSQVLKLYGAVNFNISRGLVHKGWSPVCPFFFTLETQRKSGWEMGWIRSLASGFITLLCLAKTFYLNRYSY